MMCMNDCEIKSLTYKKFMEKIKGLRTNVILGDRRMKGFQFDMINASTTYTKYAS